MQKKESLITSDRLYHKVLYHPRWNSSEWSIVYRNFERLQEIPLIEWQPFGTGPSDGDIPW